MPPAAWMLVRAAATLVAAFLAVRAVRMVMARFVHRIGGSAVDTTPAGRLKRAQALGQPAPRRLSGGHLGHRAGRSLATRGVAVPYPGATAGAGAARATASAADPTDHSNSAA